MATGLAAVGFVWAFNNPAEPPGKGAAVSIEAGLLEGDAPLEAVEPAEPVELVYRPGGDRAMAMRMTQSGGGNLADETVDTRMAFHLSESRQAPGQDGAGGEAGSEGKGGEPAVTYRWKVRDVEVTVSEGEAPVGSAIVAQVDALLMGTSQRATIDRAGIPLSAEWTSVTNPQVRETLTLMRHAQRLLFPRMRRDAINAGERWVYEFEAKPPNTDAIPGFKGEVRVETVFEGVVERDGRTLALLDRNFELSGAARVVADEESDERSLEFSGNGQGRALFDVEAGRLVESRVEMERVLRIDRDGEPVERTGTVELYWGVRQAGEGDDA